MKRICVFCGSSSGESPVYLESATRVGEILAREGLGLVYGGSRVGLMGRLADSVLEHGGEVIGVIPRALVNREVAHGGLTELRIVASMHERKAVMAELSDAFIALPGGLGTLEELFEVVTWSQLGLHQKPSGVLDVRGYYQPLIAFLDHAVNEGFLATQHRRMIMLESDPDALVARLREYEAPVVPRWIAAGET
jgi:uncharacterized protein (TIGR00730 family)